MNNTAHTCNEFGLRIWETYTPYVRVCVRVCVCMCVCVYVYEDMGYMQPHLYVCSLCVHRCGLYGIGHIMSGTDIHIRYLHTYQVLTCISGTYMYIHIRYLHTYLVHVLTYIHTYISGIYMHIWYMYLHTYQVHTYISGTYIHIRYLHTYQVLTYISGTYLHIRYLHAYLVLIS